MLVGDAGANSLQGGGGGDNLIGGGGADQLLGQDGDDNLYGQAGADTLNGGAGKDFARYDDAAAGLTVSLANPAANSGDAAGDTYVLVEGLVGSAFSDVLVGDSGANTLQGGGGGDNLVGGGGADQLLGQDGDDNLYGQAGADILKAGPARTSPAMTTRRSAWSPTWPIRPPIRATRRATPIFRSRASSVRRSATRWSAIAAPTPSRAGAAATT